MPSLVLPNHVMSRIISFCNKNEEEKAKLFKVKKNVHCEQNSQNFTNFRPRKDFLAQQLTVCFNDLLLSKSSHKIAVAGIDNLALLHASCFVYNSSKLHGDIEEIYRNILTGKACTTFTLLSVNDAKVHLLADLKQEIRQMKKHKAEPANNDEGGSSCLPLEKEQRSYLEEYEQLNTSCIRELQENELDVAIFNCLYTAHYYLAQVLTRREQLKQFFEESDQRLRAEEIPDELIGIEARLIGCVTYFPYDYDGYYPNTTQGLEVRSLSVRKAYQGCGVGRSLMEHVKDFLKDGLYKCITLTPVVDAISLYTKLGWKSRVCGRFHDMILRWNDGENAEKNENSGNDSSVLTDDERHIDRENVLMNEFTSMDECD